MAGTSSAKTRFALLPGHDEETGILRCEPTGPREARPDDGLSEPRRMSSRAVALRDAALCAAPQGDGTISYPGTTAASATSTDASASAAPWLRSGGYALSSP